MGKTYKENRSGHSAPKRKKESRDKKKLERYDKRSERSKYRGVDNYE